MRVGERYLDLVRENPLRIIRSEEEYAHSLAMLDRLSERGIDRTLDETEYLLALAVFVEKFEQQHRARFIAVGRLEALVRSRRGRETRAEQRHDQSARSSRFAF